MSPRTTTTPWRIADVLDRTDLGALLDELTTPSQRIGPGRRWHCPMPDHDDHRASVSMFRDHHGHERWRCWSGDHRGDAVDLVIATTGRARPDAIDWLATRAGMIPDHPLPPVAPKAPSRHTAVTMDPAVERYVRLCASVLRGAQGHHARDWLHGRGITDATIQTNQIGLDPGRQMLHRQRGLPYGVGAGVTFPVFDPAGHLTYVQTRYLDTDAAGRKYDNPAGALAPHPRLAFPIGPPSESPQLLVCEGLPDALTATQAGFHAVALLGAQAPDEAVAARIANHARTRGLDVVLACDPDEAGQRAAQLLERLLNREGLQADRLLPPADLDLNAWALTDPDWADNLRGASARPRIEAGIDLDLEQP